MTEKTTECSRCGEEYQEVAIHYARSECGFPELTSYQRSVCTLLVLDGVAARYDGANPRLDYHSADEERVREIAATIPEVTNEPRVVADAETVAQRITDRIEGDQSPENCSDVWGVSTISHPEFAHRDATGGVGSSTHDVERVSPDVLRWVVEEVGTWTGTIFGSLQVDLRGWSVSGSQFREILSNHGVPTVEYEGDGYAEDTFTRRYHNHEHVVVVPHYASLELLDEIDIELSEIAEPI